jgi:hypothetical protein
MPDYDPTTMALVGDMLTALEERGDTADMSYEDQLRAFQLVLFEAINTPTGEPEAVSPEAELVMREALGRLDAKAGDHELGYGEVLRRLMSVVDRELFKWTSGVTQPPGPSGDAQVSFTEISPGQGVMGRG